MEDSSSDEEEKVKLMQAVDEDFINDDLFKEGPKRCEKVTGLPNPLPSLRYPEEDNLDQFNVGLNVTPEFKNYVAKHLTNLLDQQLKEVDRSGPLTKRKVNEDSGVRLLYSSSKNISFYNPVDVSGSHNAKYKLQTRDIDSEEENLKISETAVSSDWILTGEAVKGWVKSTKGEVLVGVHKVNGTVNSTGKKKKKKQKTKIKS